MTLKAGGTLPVKDRPITSRIEVLIKGKTSFKSVVGLRSRRHHRNAWLSRVMTLSEPGLLKRNLELILFNIKQF